MLDITLCSGEHKNRGICPKRDICKRFILGVNNKSIIVSWIEAPFINKLTGTSCDLFWHYQLDKEN